MARLLRGFATVATAALLALPAATPAQDDSGLDTAPAMRAMLAWLEILDSGYYGRGWEDAAPYLKEGMPKLRFETSVQAVREPLGTVVSRKTRSAQYAPVLPGAPRGDYVVVQYTTRFANGPPAGVVETVTAMRDADGAWKAAGYVVR